MNFGIPDGFETFQNIILTFVRLGLYSNQMSRYTSNAANLQ